jgi:peptide/nickel transport system ATP-binding protein
MGLITAEPGVISGKMGFNPEGIETNLLQDLEAYVQLSSKDGRVMEVRKDCAGWGKQVERLIGNIRGKEISVIFQNPRSSLNPFIPVGKQITEAILLKGRIKNRREAKQRALNWLEQVKIDSPRLRFDSYPYGLSGGMCQRAMVAMALASEPALLIADEPTTGLDATIQSKIVDLLQELKSALTVTTMLISHDIEVIKRLSDSAAVMYGGTLMEYGPARDILGVDIEIKHPYTSALLASIPSEKHIKEKAYLQAIEGDVLDTINTPEGCRFYARCNRVTEKTREKCHYHEPDLREISPGHCMRCWLYFD